MSVCLSACCIYINSNEAPHSVGPANDDGHDARAKMWNFVSVSNNELNT